MRLLGDLEKFAHTNNAPMALRAVQDCRVAMEKQISKMDGLELAFDKIAERTRQYLSLFGLGPTCVNLGFSLFV